MIRMNDDPRMDYIDYIDCIDVAVLEISRRLSNQNHSLPAFVHMISPAPPMFSFTLWLQGGRSGKGCACCNATGLGSSLGFQRTGETSFAFWLGSGASTNTTFDHSLNQEGFIEL